MEFKRENVNGPMSYNVAKLKVNFGFGLIGVAHPGNHVSILYTFSNYNSWIEPNDNTYIS